MENLYIFAGLSPADDTSRLIRAAATTAAADEDAAVASCMWLPFPLMIYDAANQNLVKLHCHHCFHKIFLFHEILSYLSHDRHQVHRRVHWLLTWAFQNCQESLCSGYWVNQAWCSHQQSWCWTIHTTTRHQNWSKTDTSVKPHDSSATNTKILSLWYWMVEKCQNYFEYPFVILMFFETLQNTIFWDCMTIHFQICGNVEGA